jgi:hypothetical protein
MSAELLDTSHGTGHSHAHDHHHHHEPVPGGHDHSHQSFTDKNVQYFDDIVKNNSAERPEWVEMAKK